MLRQILSFIHSVNQFRKWALEVHQVWVSIMIENSKAPVRDRAETERKYLAKIQEGINNRDKEMVWENTVLLNAARNNSSLPNQINIPE